MPMNILAMGILGFILMTTFTNWTDVKAHCTRFHTWVVNGGTTGLIVWSAACLGLVSIVTLVLELI